MNAPLRIDREILIRGDHRSWIVDGNRMAVHGDVYREMNGAAEPVTMFTLAPYWESWT